MFQRSFKGVLMIFRGCLEGVLRMFQGDFMGVSSFKDVLKVIQICFRCFLIVSWGCFKGVSWESLSCLNLFNGCSKGVSMLFQDTCYLVHAIAIWYLLSNNCYLILAIWNFLSDTCYLILSVWYLLCVTCLKHQMNCKKIVSVRSCYTFHNFYHLGNKRNWNT